MPQIERRMLEQTLSLRTAKAIVTSFCNDRLTYPDRDVHLRKGICKILAEEYIPLLRLAQEHCFVRNIRLLPEANPGPDGEIRFWSRRPSKIQIVCANEGYSRALMRELLAQGNAVFSRQNRHRDQATRRVVSTGRGLATPSVDLQRRVQRILEAIDSKESKYYLGTDTLLIQEDFADFRHLREGGLHQIVCDSIRKRTEIPYRRIYINYDNALKRVK